MTSMLRCLFAAEDADDVDALFQTFHKRKAENAISGEQAGGKKKKKKKKKEFVVEERGIRLFAVDDFSS
tara:strand:- start:87 stop:293 length:207 start_codon:yes stop_codon:yes gene_type:complete